MKSTIESISNAAGKPYKGLTDKVMRDPWGSPYMIDENEGVSGGGLGTIKSAGPDGFSPGHGIGETGRRIPKS
jgi:hypothetical protein